MSVRLVLALVLLVYLNKKRHDTVYRMLSPAVLPNATVVMLDSCNTLQDVGIRGCTLSPVTHVGMIVRDASDTPFLFHTTSKRGACLAHWDTWLRAQKRRGSRVLCRTPSVGLCNSVMEDAISGLYGRRYAYHLWKSVMFRWFHAELPPDDNESLFCSELVCLVFRDLGMLDFSASELTPSRVLPVHFMEDSLPFVGVTWSDISLV